MKNKTFFLIGVIIGFMIFIGAASAFTAVPETDFPMLLFPEPSRTPMPLPEIYQAALHTNNQCTPLEME